MTTASLAPQATSDGSIATHCTISVVSTLVTPNLATTRMSYYLLHPWSLTKWLQNSSAVYELHALSLTRPPRLTNPLSPLPPLPTYSFSTARGEVENLSTPRIRQGNLELTAFLHSLDNTRNTKMLYYSHLTSIRQEPRTKWCHSSQPWGNSNILFWNDSIAQK